MAVQFRQLSFDEAERDDLRQSLRLTPAERFRRGITLYERHLRLSNQSMRLVDDFHLRLISLFNEKQLSYLTVGGHAVNVHGYLRASDDFDIWLENSITNLSAFRRVLLQIGIDSEVVYKLVQTIAKPDDRSVVRFLIDDYTVDFLLHLDGLADFQDCQSRCLTISVGDTLIPFISLEDLIATKRASGRLKDQLDIEMLQKIDDEKENRRTDFTD